MSENVKLLRPEQKHGESEAVRKSTGDVTQLPLYITIAKAISSAKGFAEHTPVTLYGVNTQEYVIVPCNPCDQDPSILRVLTYLRGEGWLAETFRISESMENPKKYRHAVLVCWDPKVLNKSCVPKYYSSRTGIKVPCGSCNKQDTGDVERCKGCITLRMWLAGVAVLKGFGDPCTRCAKNRSKLDAVPQCQDCPTRRLWISIQEEGEEGGGEVAPVAEEQG